MKGFVYLIGVGPGDVDLITLKALKAIEAADVLVYDRLANPELLNHNPKARLIDVGKKPGAHSKTQDEINQILIQEAMAGQCVVRIKGGDPFVFGRGSEEGIELKQAGIAFEVIPGISSSIAAPMYAGIPVTHRKIATSFHVITGHEAVGDSSVNYEALAKVAGTLVFLMGFEHIESITSSLMANGKSAKTPAAVIMNGTRKDQKVVYATLETLVTEAQKSNLSSPSVIVIGDVVNVAYGLGYNQTGNRVILTKETLGNVPLSSIVRQIGLNPHVYVQQSYESKRIEINQEELTAFDDVVFTSERGVQSFFDNMKHQKIDYRKLQSRVFAVGRKTAEVLAGYGIFDVHVPKEIESAVGLIKLLKDKQDPQSTRKLLLVRGDYGTAFPKHEIEGQYHIVEWIVYHVNQLSNPIKEMLAPSDCIFFASPSAVHKFEENAVDTKACHVICIGETTRQAAVEAGYQDVHTMVNPDYQSFQKSLESIYSRGEK